MNKLFTLVIIPSFLFTTLISAFPTPHYAHEENKSNSGQATFYTPGLGSCGNVHNESSHIVAINSAQGDGNKHCGKTVSITNQNTGKSVSAKVVDSCPGCKPGDLDLSPAVFQALGGTEEQGVFPIIWDLKSNPTSYDDNNHDSFSSKDGE